MLRSRPAIQMSDAASRQAAGKEREKLEEALATQEEECRAHMQTEVETLSGP